MASEPARRAGARPVRPGLELFTARLNDEPLRVAAGTGAIVDVDIFDVRAGVHVGITDAAEDLRTSIWISKVFALTSEPEPERPSRTGRRGAE
jgi:hypothetical protein